MTFNQLKRAQKIEARIKDLENLLDMFYYFNETREITGTDTDTISIESQRKLYNVPPDIKSELAILIKDYCLENIKNLEKEFSEL